MTDPYARIEQAIAYIRTHAERRPRLAEVAGAVGLSPWHFQRLFREWAGISPQRYQAFLTLARAKQLLDGPWSLLHVAQEVGLSGPSRLHDHFVSLAGLTPGEFKSRGAGLRIAYGFHPSPYGEVLLAETRRGVCLLAFTAGKGRAQERRRLQRAYPAAELVETQAETRATWARVFQTSEPQRFHLAVRGTNLQVQVWQALLAIPWGETCSYGELACRLGRPQAARAVANAVAANPVNFLIPCHRVLRANGDLGGFRGGSSSKRRLLQREGPDSH